MTTPLLRKGGVCPVCNRRGRLATGSWHDNDDPPTPCVSVFVCPNHHAWEYQHDYRRICPVEGSATYAAPDWVLEKVAP